MVVSNLLPIIEAVGTPYEIGYTHGSAAKKQIENCIDTYSAMFKDYAGMDWETATQIVSRYEEAVREYDEESWEEIEGIAAGAGLKPWDILALNARSEIVLTGQFIEGCTSLALTPEATCNGNTLLAQNWDWKASQRDALILLKMRQKNKPSIAMVTEAGVIGKIGLNSAGLGVCLNALATEEPPEGVPLHIILRGILNSEIISDAIEAVGRTKIACAANFLIAHANGEAVDIEAAPTDFDVMYPEDGIIVHSNHFISPRLTNQKDYGKRIIPDSFIRLGRMTKNIKRKKILGIKDIQELLQDHVEYPDSICRHEDLSEEPGQRKATVFSIIMDLERRELHIAPGAPCNTAFQLHTMF
ncbi:MAG: hypothetical protein GX349_02265 [Firmicutes bacterium]|nr:hypothetical protein [Bacillota bacterium]